MKEIMRIGNKYWSTVLNCEAEIVGFNDADDAIQIKTEFGIIFTYPWNLVEVKK